MNDEIKRLAAFEAIDNIITNTIAAHGDRLVPGSAEIISKLLKESCLGVDRDHVPGRVAEFLESHPVAKRLANGESTAKPESVLKTAARAHGVKESALTEFVAEHAAGAAFCESTAAIYDHVARQLNDDSKAERYLAYGAPPDPRVVRARDVLAQFGEFLVGSIDELARGPFRDIGAMNSDQAFATVASRLRDQPIWYREFSRGGQPADFDGADIRPDPKRSLAQIRDQFGPEFANRYSGMIAR